MSLTTVLFDLDDTLFDHVGTARAALTASTAQFCFGPAVTLDALYQRYSDLLEEMHPRVLAGEISHQAARHLRFRRLLEPYGVLPDDQAGLRSVDPTGAIALAIPLARVLGCVVHANTSMPEPGLVQHHAGRGLIIGEPDGSSSSRARAVASLLGDAGFDTTLTDNIRHAIWYKLWGNMTMNPLSAVTGATVDRILDGPRSVVIQEARNRMVAQMAVLYRMMKG